jgi:hypothetical protein
LLTFAVFFALLGTIQPDIEICITGTKYGSIIMVSNNSLENRKELFAVQKQV